MKEKKNILQMPVKNLQLVFIIKLVSYIVKNKIVNPCHMIITEMEK